MTISDDDQYLFDLQGYLVIKGALDADTVARLNGVIDERMPEPKVEQPMTGLMGMLDWDAAFADLLDHPRVLPHLQAWVDPALRLDSAYGIHTVAGTPQLDLHLGGTPYRRVAYYHHRDATPFIGLTVVSWALTDVPPGKNGFACVPGSHKSNVAPPTKLMKLEDEMDCVKQIPADAGDAIIFTEALTHGSYAWTLPQHRRVLFYRYTPGHMTFDRQDDWTAADLDKLTPRQRSLFEPAYARKRRDDHSPGDSPVPRAPIG